MNAATEQSLSAQPLADPAEQAVSLHEAGVEAYHAGRAAEAERLFLSAVELFETHDGADSPDVAAVLNDLGAVAEDRCDYETALQRFRRAAEIIEPLGDSEDEDLQRLCLQSWGNLGRLTRIQGRYDEAKQICKRALDYAQATFGVESVEAADALNNLGMVGKFAGWFDEAEGYYHRAVAILERERGVDHVSLASLFHNLGGLEHARGRFAKGEPYARRSVELREKAVGKDHSDVAADVAALAALLDGQGKYKEAEQLYNRALEIFRRTYGEEHYEIA
ncbi:MAG: tetratricopeptide repeat protein, partial [Acidobacteriota bacterium]|nr:tetratricopeptide repeat protein [Acidobacteriota bacterium]